MGVDYVDPKFPNPHGPQDANVIIYGYRPSFALAVLAIVLFTISMIIHGGQIIRYRTWYFLPMFFGTLMEIVGYVFRSLSAKRDPYHVIYFVVQYFFIVVAPVFFSASIYTILSKLLRLVTVVDSDEDGDPPPGTVPNRTKAFLPFSRRAILITFVLCDVIATVIQIIGAASIGAAESDGKDATMANNILLGGLAFQVFTFFVFLVLLAIFLTRARKMVASTSAALRPFSIALVLASVLVYLRTCFRLAETAQGLGGSISSHEAYFGVLEFVPILIAVFVLNFWHPGKWIPSSSSSPARVPDSAVI